MPTPTGFVFVDDPRTFSATGATTAFVSRRIRKKRDLFGVLKRQLGLPAHFGRNWDALNDSLQAIAQPTVLIHDGLPFGDGSKSRGIYLELLRGLVETNGSPWTIVFPNGVEESLQEPRP
jgi:hypothetical protein